MRILKMSETLDQLCDESLSKCIRVMFHELTSEYELHLNCLDSANQILLEEYQTTHELVNSLEQRPSCGNFYLLILRRKTITFGKKNIQCRSVNKGNQRLHSFDSRLVQ